MAKRMLENEENLLRGYQKQIRKTIREITCGKLTSEELRRNDYLIVPLLYQKQIDQQESLINEFKESLELPSHDFLEINRNIGDYKRKIRDFVKEISRQSYEESKRLREVNNLSIKYQYRMLYVADLANGIVTRSDFLGLLQENEPLEIREGNKQNALSRLIRISNRRLGLENIPRYITEIREIERLYLYENRPRRNIAWPKDACHYK